MMNACLIAPIIKGKRSLLYEGLYKATGKDRKLTNFLYALSKQDSIKSQFESKDYNSQGEIKPKVFMEKLGVNNLVTTQQALQNERRAIGATDSNDKPIGYNTPDEIYQRVMDYNDSHQEYKANIKFADGKFQIELNGLNAANYEASRSLESRKAEFDEVVNYLATLGFDTNFTDEVRTANANFLNSVGFKRTLKDMAEYSAPGQNGYIFTPQTARLLMDLFVPSPLLERIKDRFGDETMEVLSFVSGRDLTVLSPEASALLDSYWKNKVETFLVGARTKLATIKPRDLETAAQHARSQIAHGTTDYFGVSSAEINKTLKDLYSLYYLDKETLDTLHQSIQSLSAAADTFLRLGVKNLEIQRSKQGTKRGDDVQLKALKREIERGRYAQSIVSFLENLEEKISRQQEEIDSLANQFTSAPNSLEAINKLSGVILDVLDTYGAYHSILETLMNVDQLEQDQMDVPAELIDQIKVVANSLQATLVNAKNFARDKQFDCVYAFMKLHWGPDDIKEFGDEQYSLEQILRAAQSDINLLDRFIYSLNECNDTALGIIYEVVKTKNRDRNAILHRGQFIVRTLTENLYKESSSEFMFVRDENNIPTGKLISNINYEKFEADREAERQRLIDEGYTGRELTEKLDKWEKRNTRRVKPFTNSIYTNAIIEYATELYGRIATPDDYSIEVVVPDPKKYGDTSAIDNLTSTQREYYYKMMALRSVLSVGLPNAEFGFFNAIQLSADFTTALKEAGGNPTRLLQMVKNMVTDAFQHREDDDEYGLSDILADNDLKQALSDVNGHELMKLPIFFTHEIKDKTRLSTDFSRGMLAMMATTVQYNEMNKVLDSLMLTKDWMLSQRETQKTAGSQVMTDMFTWGREMYINSVNNDVGASSSAGLLMDFYEKNVYGRTKKDEGTVTVFGCRVSVDKAVDFLTGYTSVTGLSMNLLGAQANMLVGKLQMIIEAGCGEFFDLKDFAVGEVEYFHLLPELLLELTSNNKSSKLGLLMEQFDVLDDYFNQLKEAGFYKSPIGKMLGNTNIMFLYGMGEHCLHAVTMLAVLNRTKLYDTQTNTEVSLLSAYEVNKVGSNGKLNVDTTRYKWIERDSKGKMTSTREITGDDFTRVEKIISYCNKSMHGAFGDVDRGMIHRYAAGRLIMNFRQWMPAHYGRRFRGLHYDADLGEFRRGFYVSAAPFVWECVKDFKNMKLQWGTHWEELSPMDQYNCKRALAETIIFASLVMSNLSLGRYKDKKGNWAYRNLMYQVKRMLMEVQASTPIPMPGSGFGLMGFEKNIITTLNSPAAALNTIEKLATIADLSTLFETVENGKHRGENLYLHKMERAVPFYGSVRKQMNLGEEDYLFNVFKQAQK